MRIHTYEEARAASIKYFNGDELASDVFCGKYALQDLKGNIYELTPADMHRRLAREFARIEAKYPNPMSEDEVYESLSDWSVVPQGGPMSAIGNPFQVQSLSNCFVVESPHDSYGGIMKTDQEQVQIMKRRGGVGFDISTIRPKGLPAANAARTTDGIGVFMERYSNTCREVAQGGRRGALMLTMSVHHPEVLTFANIKRDRTKVTGANVSIRVTDEFMQAVREGTTYKQRFPVERNVPHTVEHDVDAREVWRNIVAAMRDCSEPGMLFWDTVRGQGPAEMYHEHGFSSISSNPCGEQPLPAKDSCRLMLVNLSRFVNDPFGGSSRFDFERFNVAVVKAQRLMDDLVDLEVEAIDAILEKIKQDPEPENVKRVELELWNGIRQTAIDGRRTGLGITALGDAIAMLGMAYASDDAIKVTDKIYRQFALGAYRSTVTLAKERGAFPVYSFGLDKVSPLVQRIMAEDDTLRADYEKHGRRNIAVTTTAPAGSVSILTQTTSGCEPVLFLKSKRKRKINPSDKQAHVDEVDKLGDRWQVYDLFHHGISKWMEATGEVDVTKSPYHGSTVEEIDWMKKIDIQAAAQKWICSGISNTTNLPEDVSTETVEKLCMRAWETGCKGVTIYRAGSRDAVIVKEGQATASDQPLVITETHAPKRPKELPCDIHRTSVQGETYLVIVGLFDGKPYEVIAGLQEHVEVPRKVKSGILVKNGKNKDGIATYNLRVPMGDDDDLVFKDIVNLFDNPAHGALTRMISLSLRHGVPMNYLVEQLKKDKHSDLQSFSNVIARVLKTHIKDGTAVATEKTCGNCNAATLVYQQGCVACSTCGWSKC